VDEPRAGGLPRLDRAARLVLGLEDVNVPARVGQEVRGDEAVVPRSDDDGVGDVALLPGSAEKGQRPDFTRSGKQGDGYVSAPERAKETRWRRRWASSSCGG